MKRWLLAAAAVALLAVPATANAQDKMKLIIATNGVAVYF